MAPAIKGERAIEAALALAMVIGCKLGFGMGHGVNVRNDVLMGANVIIGHEVSMLQDEHTSLGHGADMRQCSGPSRVVNTGHGSSTSYRVGAGQPVLR